MTTRGNFSLHPLGYSYFHQRCITASGSNCHQLLAALGETEKNTPLQSPNLPWIFATSITKPPVETHHFNHQTSRGYSPLQSPNLRWKPTPINQATGGKHMAWDLFSLPASSADSTLLHSQGQMDPHTPPPLWAWHPPIQPRGLDMAI